MASLTPPVTASVLSLQCISQLEESLLAACTVSGNGLRSGVGLTRRTLVSTSRRSRLARLGAIRSALKPAADEDEGTLESLIEKDVLEQVFQTPRTRVAPLVGKKGWRLERPGQLQKDSLIPLEWKPVQQERNKGGKEKKREYIGDLVKAAQEKEARKRNLVNGREDARTRPLVNDQQDEVGHRTFLPRRGTPWKSTYAATTFEDRPASGFNKPEGKGYEKSEAATFNYDFDTGSDEDEDEDESRLDEFVATMDNDSSQEGSSLRWEAEDSEDEDDDEKSDRDESEASNAVEGQQSSELTVVEEQASVPTGRAKPRDPFVELGDRSLADVVKSLDMDTSETGKGPIQQPPTRRQTGVDLDAIKAMFSKRPANFLKACTEKWKPLHTISATWERSINLPRLLRYDIDIDERDKDGMTALHRAVCNGRRITVKYLAEAGADAEVRDKDGATLLHYAARAGVSDVARDLLKLRLDPNAIDDDGWTPLHVAVQSGRKDMVKRFLTYGAEANIHNKDGCTAIDLAVAYAKACDFYEVVKLFQLSPEQTASLERRPTVHEADQYLDRFKQFGSTVPEKWMPLHTLAASGNLFHMCELLRQGGINLEAEDKDGETALWKAVIYGKPTSAKHLIEAGANPFLQDSHGATLLHYAAQNGFLDNIKKLTKRSVFVNSPDQDGWTPLHVAVMGGRKEVILCLLNRGADRYIRNSDGNMVLDIAASFGRKFGYYQVAKVISKAQFKQIKADLAAQEEAESAVATSIQDDAQDLSVSTP